jgi:hypothetical protein
MQACGQPGWNGDFCDAASAASTGLRRWLQLQASISIAVLYFSFFSEFEQHLARHTQLLTWLGLNLAPMDHTMNNLERNPRLVCYHGDLHINRSC